MILILIGLVVIFLPIPIPAITEVGVFLIDYMPHWVGYVLVLFGLLRQRESAGRTSALAVTVAAILGGGVVWVMSLIGIVVSFPVIEILQVWMAYCILRWCEGFEEMGQTYRIRSFRMSWYALLGTQIAAFVLGMAMPPMAFVWSLAAFGAGVAYTYTYYRLQALVER